MKPQRSRVIIFAILLLTSILPFATCGFISPAPLKISVSNWVGYTPLFYIQEKGWMKEEIRFMTVSSLMESEKLFQAGMTDGFAGTQFEFLQGRTVSQTLEPALLISRSNGGDGIVSNLTLEGLRKADREITVYLEIQTVNNSLFSSFIKEYRLEGIRFRKVNRNQADIAAMKPTADPCVLVTYEPYKTELVKNGFIEIASTRDVNLLVLDALFVESRVFDHREASLIKLKGCLLRAIGVIRTDPREFYETVQPYLGKQTYPEFMDSLKGLEWIADGITEDLRASLVKNGIPLERIAQ
jgi:NitT/TauT family transport system substrate-binding protein